MNRRHFLQATGGAAVSFTVLGLRAAETSGDEPAGLIDTNVTLGRWPLRRLPLDDTNALAAKLRKHGVTQAWAGNFDAVFGKDLRGANAWLAAECRKRGRGMFVPFGTLNPGLPGWEEELRRCIEEYRMQGVRLFPNYHSYKLDSPEFAKLFTATTERKLILQIAASIEDERTQNPSARAKLVDVKPLLTLLKSTPARRVMLLNWQRGLATPLVKQLAQLGVTFEIATVENVGGVANLAEEISASRVVFGSHAPCFYFESAQLKLKEANLAKPALREISGQNAARLLAPV